MATILLVNDEKILRTLVAAGLRRGGHHVLQAASARRATQLASRHKVDLLITELALPNGDGLSLATELHRLGSQVPVLFLSRSPHPAHLERKARAEGFLIIREPFDISDLLGEVAARLPVASAVRKPPSSGSNPAQPAARRGS